MSDIDEEIKREQEAAIEKLRNQVPVAEEKQPVEAKQEKPEVPALEREDAAQDEWIFDDEEKTSEKEAPKETASDIQKEEPDAPVEPAKQTAKEERVEKEVVWHEKYKKEDIDNLEVEVAFYRNMFNEMKTNPNYLSQIAPEAFAPRKSARQTLEEKYGKEFLESEFDARESVIPGTRSFQFAEDARELVAQEKMNNPQAMAIGALANRKKLFDEGMQHMQKILLDLKKEVPYITEKEFSDRITAMNHLAGNPIKAVAELVKEAILRENDIKKKEKSLQNDKTVLREKRNEVLASPPGAQVSSGKTNNKEPKGDFDDLDTTY